MQKTLQEVLDWYTDLISEGQFVGFLYGFIGVFEYTKGSNELEFIHRMGEQIEVKKIKLGGIQLVNETPFTIKMIDNTDIKNVYAYFLHPDNKIYKSKMSALRRVGIA